VDPLAGAATFATIVGLLSNFKNEHSSGEISEFIQWLKDKNHQDIAADVIRNKLLLGELSRILEVNHDDLCQKLATLNDVLASVAANIDGFNGLASATNPESVLSPQAVSVIKQLVDSGAKEFIEHKYMSGEPDAYTLIGAPGDISYDEPRFMEDDLNTLVELGLLRLEFGSRGSKRFQVTRNAVKLVSTLDR
jgi:hypothetical protein